MVDPDRVQQRLELLSIVAAEAWRAPVDLADAFTVLAEHAVIDGGLAGRLRGLAGLRTRLVHVYDTIDDARVHAAIGGGLPDIDAFAAAVALVARPDG